MTPGVIDVGIVGCSKLSRRIGEGNFDRIHTIQNQRSEAFSHLADRFDTCLNTLKFLLVIRRVYDS